jgi:steroid delta-isomerase-like uncharacterized protein
MGKFTDTTHKLANAINSHDPDAIAKFYAADAIAYDPMYPQPLRGREAIKKDSADFFRAFPDMRLEMVTVVEADDRTGAGELKFTGTNTGAITTPTGDEIPATNKRIDLRGAAFVSVNDRGEITEERRYYDVTSMLRQLGIAPEQATTEVGARR